MTIHPPDKDCTIQEFKQWVVDVVDARREELKETIDMLAWLEDPAGGMRYKLSCDAFELRPTSLDVFELHYYPPLGAHKNFPLDNSPHNV